MLDPQPPTIASVDVIATQPTAGDVANAQRLSRGAAIAATEANAGAPPVEPSAVYVVRIKLAEMPSISSSGWALYVGEERIPKYWEYAEGIYFKVTDPNFLTRHAGHALQFSTNGKEFVDTGKKMEAQPGAPSAEALAAPAADSGRALLPTQAEVLQAKQ